MLAATAGDVHPPLYYLLIWPLGQLHASIWVLRIPGALLSLASVWLFWRVLEELHIPLRVQYAAMILMAVMPIQLYYAQEARMYSLLEFLVLAACLAMLRKHWAWFGLVCGLMLYTQYYAIFYIFAIWTIGIIREPDDGKSWEQTFQEIGKLFTEPDEWMNFVEHPDCWALTFAIFAFTPWALVMFTQMHTLSGNYWMQLTGVGMLPRVLFENLFMPPANAVTQIPLMLGSFAWLIVALIYATRHYWNNNDIGEIAILAFLPFALAVLVSLVWQPVLHYRPLIGISPFLYILLALPVEACFHGNSLKLRTALCAAIVIIPLILVPDASLYLFARANKTSGASIALAYIQSRWQPGDIVYAFGDDGWVNTTPYSNLPIFKAPDCGLTLGALSPATRQAIGMQVRPLSSLDYKRAWLLWSDSPVAPTCAASQLTSLGLDPKKPLLVTAQSEYVFEGLWLKEGK
jgi:hypothetical protein